MRSFDEVKADLDALPPQQRQAISGAARSGTAIADPTLAPLAAEWARVSRERFKRLITHIVAPLVVLTIVIELAIIMRSDSSFGFGGAITVAILTVAMMSLIMWAVGWRPFVRAERANLAIVGEAAPPRRREPSHWVLAWIIGWPIAALVGFSVHLAGSDALAGPIGFVVWLAILYTVKRTLDRRRA